MKKYEQMAAVTINPPRAEKTRTRPMRRLIWALAILSFSVPTIHVAAQKVARPKIAPPGPKVEYYVDLVPLPAPGASNSDPVDFCYGNQPPKLDVRVHNQGNEAAPSSKVRVVFSVQGSSKTFIKLVPGIPARGTQTLQFDRPPDCKTDCDFSITVDSQNEVQERGEGNNTVSARCLG